jgi:hypothetical protein
MSTDPNPEPTSDAPAPHGADASGDHDGGSGESTDGVTLNELAEQKAKSLMQGSMDRNIAHMNNGRYTDMDPKVLELLDGYEKIVSGNKRGAAAETKPAENAYNDILLPSSKADESSPSPLEEKGREALRQETVAKLEEQISDRWVKEQWRTDAEAFFKDIGEVKNFDPNDFASVDLTDSDKFPINKDGYAQWLRNATVLRVKYLNEGNDPPPKAEGTETVESSMANAVDRAKAKRTKRQPAPNSAASPASNLVEAAKQRSEGKMSDADFRDEIKKRIPRGGRVV